MMNDIFGGVIKDLAEGPFSYIGGKLDDIEADFHPPGSRVDRRRPIASRPRIRPPIQKDAPQEMAIKDDRGDLS